MAIQRNLPTDTTYELVDSYYNGGIEAGAGECCQNCGRFISNVAIVKNKYGRYHVGMDCASTLTGIKDTFSFEYEHKARFQQAKQARNTLLKAMKGGARKLWNDHLHWRGVFYREEGAFWYFRCERNLEAFKNVQQLLNQYPTV